MFLVRHNLQCFIVSLQDSTNLQNIIELFYVLHLFLLKCEHVNYCYKDVLFRNIKNTLNLSIL